jgi:hypothetical protein
MRKNGSACSSSANVHDHREISRPSGGANGTDASGISHPANSERISRAATPHTCGFAGLLTLKSNHRMAPPGLRTRNISPVTARFSSEV